MEIQKRRNAVRTVKFAAMLVFGAVIGLGCSGCSLFEASYFRNRELKALTPAETEKLTQVERSCYAFFIETHTRACIRSCELHGRKVSAEEEKELRALVEDWLLKQVDIFKKKGVYDEFLKKVNDPEVVRGYAAIMLARSPEEQSELHDKLADYARKKYPRYMEFWAKDEGICYTSIRYRADVQWLLK